MKILLIDIETAPHRVYAWGLWKQNIYLDQIEEEGYTMCFAAKWLHEDHTLYYGLNKHTKDEMLRSAFDLIDEADAVIHYNGTSFDMPTLNREFLGHGLGRPAPYKQIDLLKTARKQFRFASNKLDFVAQFLGVGAKHKHKGMEVWRDCMAGKEEGWAVMEPYNIQDVTILEGVYHKLLPWIDGHPNRALYDDGYLARCGKCGSDHLQKRGFSYTATMRYQRYQCQACNGWSRERTNNLSKEKKASIMVEAR